MTSGEEKPKENVEELLEQDIQREVETGFLANLIGWPVLSMVLGFSFYKLTTEIVPYQFIDEIFHVDQTVRYISGRWTEWNPKITTPPGLYILGWFNYKIMHFFTSWSTLTILRMVNLLGGVVVWPWIVLRPLFLFNAIGFWPITLMSFPLMAAYYYLYYTDVWSTILIVESLTLALTLPFGETASIWLSALCGLVSCTFRQTNIIWNIFVMVLVVERRALIHKDFNNVNFNNYLKFTIHAIENFHTLILPYALNMVAFALFLLFNRSITLGDKDNHVAGLHGVQFFYCLTFMAVFSAPIWVSRLFLKSYLTRNLGKPLRFIFELLGIILVIRYFTVIHPFLLADNRHFTFYLLKKIITRNFCFKYLLMPAVYHFATFTYIEVVRPRVMHFHPILPIEIKSAVDLPIQLTHISWTVLILCTFMTVVPSPLFEPRYYILPFIFWRLFVSASPEAYISKEVPTRFSCTKRLTFELIWFIIINAFTLFIFIKYPFVWTTEQYLQRITW